MDKKTYWLAFFLFLSAFLIFFNGRFGGDGMEHYLTAESIVLDGDLAIHDRPFGVKEMHSEDRGVIGQDGKIYSAYGIGMGLLLVPLYFAGHLISQWFRPELHDYITNFTVSLVNPVLTALSAVILLGLILELGYRLKTALWAAVIYAFSTMGFIYIRSGFYDPALTLCYLSAALAILKFKDSRKRAYLIASGAFIAYALLIKKGSAIAIPAYLLYIWIIAHNGRERLKNIVIYLLPVFCSVAVIFFVHYAVFGSVIRTEHGDMAMTLEKALPGRHMIKGLYYYLFSSGKSYFIYNIPLILSLFGIRPFLKKHKNEAILALSFIAVHILFYAHVFKRGSLFSWGPRYLLPTVPFMVIFLAEYIETAGTVLKRRVITLFMAAGCILQAPALLVNFTNYINFVKNSLLLDEYLINFVPDLSPLKGVWAMFISLLSGLTGSPVSDFTFNPDYLLVGPRTAALKGYDRLDIWWVNILNAEPSFFPFIIAGAIILCAAILFCFLKLIRLRGRQ